jgi:hypothetical protein
MKIVLTFIYFEYIIWIFGYVMAFRFVIKKGSTLFKSEKVGKTQKNSINKYGEHINLIIKIIISIILIISLIRIIPLTLDIPFALTGKTELIMVSVIRNDISNPEKMKQRDIVVEDDNNGKRFAIHVWGYAIRRGDILLVEILPFSKFGAIIEKIK